jgi:hypothetical protein
MNRPFKTLDAARTAALSGDTVFAFPGSYTPSGNLAKDGVNWFFYEGAIVSAVNSIFSGTNLNFDVMGYGQFSCTTTPFSFSATTSSTIRFFANLITAPNSFPSAFQIGSNVTITINVISVVANAGAVFTLGSGTSSTSSSINCTVSSCNIQLFTVAAATTTLSSYKIITNINDHTGPSCFVIPTSLTTMTSINAVTTIKNSFSQCYADTSTATNTCEFTFNVDNLTTSNNLCSLFSTYTTSQFIFNVNNMASNGGTSQAISINEVASSADSTFEFNVKYINWTVGDIYYYNGTGSSTFIGNFDYMNSGSSTANRCFHLASSSSTLSVHRLSAGRVISGTHSCYYYEGGSVDVVLTAKSFEVVGTANSTGAITLSGYGLLTTPTGSHYSSTQVFNIDDITDSTSSAIFIINAIYGDFSFNVKNIYHNSTSSPVFNYNPIETLNASTTNLNLNIGNVQISSATATGFNINPNIGTLAANSSTINLFGMINTIKGGVFPFVVKVQNSGASTVLFNNNLNLGSVTNSPSSAVTSLVELDAYNAATNSTLTSNMTIGTLVSANGNSANPILSINSNDASVGATSVNVANITVGSISGSGSAIKLVPADDSTMTTNITVGSISNSFIGINIQSNNTATLNPTIVVESMTVTGSGISCSPTSTSITNPNITVHNMTCGGQVAAINNAVSTVLNLGSATSTASTGITFLGSSVSNAVVQVAKLNTSGQGFILIDSGLPSTASFNINAGSVTCGDIVLRIATPNAITVNSTFGDVTNTSTTANAFFFDGPSQPKVTVKQTLQNSSASNNAEVILVNSSTAGGVVLDAQTITTAGPSVNGTTNNNVMSIKGGTNIISFNSIPLAVGRQVLNMVNSTTVCRLIGKSVGLTTIAPPTGSSFIYNLAGGTSYVDVEYTNVVAQTGTNASNYIFNVGVAAIADVIAKRVIVGTTARFGCTNQNYDTTSTSQLRSNINFVSITNTGSNAVVGLVLRVTGTATGNPAMTRFHCDLAEVVGTSPSNALLGSTQATIAAGSVISGYYRYTSGSSTGYSSTATIGTATNVVFFKDITLGNTTPVLNASSANARYTCYGSCWGGTSTTITNFAQVTGGTNAFNTNASIL